MKANVDMLLSSLLLVEKITSSVSISSINEIEAVASN